MKRKLCGMLCMLLLSALLSGCTHAEEATAADLTATDSDMFTDRDLDPGYDADDCVQIQLNGDSATATSDSVQISGTTISITEEAVYVVSGALDDGMIVVNASDSAKIQLVLDGASIHSETSAALYVAEADKVFVTLADGTENALSNGGTFTAIDSSNIDGALFSRQDLTLNGGGSLSVASPAGHGIVCKDDLAVTGGSFAITAASHGLDANDSIRITGSASLSIEAGKDGLHAENDDDASLGFVYISDGALDIAAEGDGISAGAYLQISDGAFNIVAGGGSENGESETSDFWGGFRGGARPGRGQDMEPSAAPDSDADSGTSMKGLKAESGLTISGGSFVIDSADDAVHSNTTLSILGGSFDVASGDDAFHADETLTVTGGIIRISESYEGLEALRVEIQGGEISLVAEDDGLNAAGGNDSSGMTGGRDGRFGGGWGGGSSSSDGAIVISGGTLSIQAFGDGIDANGSIEITGGTITISGPSQGDTSTLDYDTTATITGGTFFGTGASGMARSFSDSTQGILFVNVGDQAAGTSVSISDASGNVLISAAPELSFSVVIFSSPDVASGETYTVAVGSDSWEVQAA